jgi:hypothetical protein
VVARAQLVKVRRVAARPEREVAKAREVAALLERVELKRPLALEREEVKLAKDPMVRDPVTRQ